MKRLLVLRISKTSGGGGEMQRDYPRGFTGPNTPEVPGAALRGIPIRAVRRSFLPAPSPPRTASIPFQGGAQEIPRETLSCIFHGRKQDFLTQHSPREGAKKSHGCIRADWPRAARGSSWQELLVSTEWGGAEQGGLPRSSPQDEAAQGCSSGT